MNGFSYGIFVIWAAFAAGRAVAGEEVIKLKNVPGSEVTATRCVTCHSLDYIQMNAVVMNRAAWQKTIRKMIDRYGAPVTEEDAREILQYLATNYSLSP
jgi:cytochrome c5